MATGKKKLLGLFIDPIYKLNVNKDTSCRLAAEAESRGFDVFYFNTNGLYFDNGDVRASGQMVHFDRGDGIQNDHWFGEDKDISLKKCDAILVRRDPPMDSSYLTATYMLDLLRDDVVMINDPMFMRNSHSKLQALQFSQFMVPTLIASDKAAVKRFFEAHQDIILKPVHGMGGQGVVRMKDGKDPNFNSLVDTMLKAYGGHVMAQQYIQGADQGEKRIILFDGDVYGAIIKKAATGDFRGNISAGATFEKTDLTDREKEIVAALKPYIQERNLFFVGLDVINGHVIEINSISPGALSWANMVYDTPFERIFWDVFDKKYA